MLSRIQTDVLVIGAGPAGCLAAAFLKKRGFDVTVVEKQKFPRFVIGESLLPRVMGHLEDAGLLEAIKDMGFQEKRGALFIHGNEVCEFDFSEKFSEGWDWTWQVKRADFDKALADDIFRKGVNLLFETTVTQIEFSGTDSITTIVSNDGTTSEVSAKFIVDASGYGRVIPRMFDLEQASSLSPKQTVFSHLKDEKRTDDSRIIALIIKENTWAWIIPFSDGTTSLGIVSDAEYFNSFSEAPLSQFREIIESNDFLKARFGEADLVFEPKKLGGYAVSCKKLYGEGVVLVGNATEFLDPIFSSGVTFAVESGHLAGDLVADFLEGKKVDWEEDYSVYMRKGIEVFKTYVEAWYSGDLQHIFFAPKPDLGIKRQICSVLAGYVWDTENPFVRRPEKSLKALSSFLEIRNKSVK
ncbi:NAD(P)/FAD-dependent oxidoreductase [Arcticibacterium luteifluviistationis]|uniref:Pyridine nucleotide-disulfide oxidoreductase n=1 Tax=Arcticibacterium luteifluviistationis TaxID=1784714 RepID=A0A2Z4GD46_9BACT|nr:NAD(P)/FAD-dependent oxidoreductase [Arcticibacterium luteifluviistationis]AWV99156.1 pyridine nucleotide-disulfide oxidoreductase [Arcticibacterium luteifluviistationis]